MKKAKEIIVSTLKEEIPFLTEEKYDSMAIRLVKELGLTDVKIFDINEAKENGYETFTPMRYNLELSLEDILLVEKNIGTKGTIYIDPLYTYILKEYFSLLGRDSANTVAISTEEFVKSTICSNAETPEADWLKHKKNPCEFIRRAINEVCDCVGYYRAHR